MLALVTRVFVIAEVEPRPSVKAAVLHVGDVVGREIIAEAVALDAAALPHRNGNGNGRPALEVGR